MAILAITDFTSQVVADKINNFPAYITDTQVTMYWHKLANQFSIDIEYLPDSSEISTKVKQYLITSVMVHVAFDSIGSTLKQLSEGIVVDEWKNRYDVWTGVLEDMLASMSASDVYDPDNPPDAEDISNPSVVTWSRS